MIPRILWQGWIGEKPIPEREAKWCAEMKRMNPDFRHVLFGNEILERYGRDAYVMELMSRGEPKAFVMDRLRCLLLRDEGGIWLDPDCQPVRPLKRLDAIWNDSRITFAHGFRPPLRKDVHLHRGITFADNTFLASAPNSRIINRVLEAWTQSRPVVNGHDIGVQVLTYIDSDVCSLNYEYFYDLKAGPNALVLHDAHNLASWVPKKTLKAA